MLRNRRLGFLIALLLVSKPCCAEEYKTPQGFILNFDESHRNEISDVQKAVAQGKSDGLVLHNGKWLPEAEVSAAIKQEIAADYDRQVIADPLAYKGQNGGVQYFGDQNGNRISKEQYIQNVKHDMERSLAETNEREAMVKATTTPEVYAINKPVFEEGRQMVREFYDGIEKKVEEVVRPSTSAPPKVLVSMESK